jgi:hypothetical protein
VPLYDSKGNFVGAIEAIRDIMNETIPRKIRGNWKSTGHWPIYTPPNFTLSTMEE